MNALALVRTAIGVVTFAAAGQLVAVATGHAWGPWSAPTAAHGGAAAEAGKKPASSHSPSSKTRPTACPPTEADDRPVAPGDGLGQVLIVVVPSTSILETDDKGRVVASTTNTGCPPRVTDDLWLRAPNGSLEAAAPTALRGVHWYADPADAGSYVRHPPHP